jgi:hypothetical protein
MYDDIKNAKNEINPRYEFSNMGFQNIGICRGLIDQEGNMTG